jgi:hypothetical protein
VDRRTFLKSSLVSAARLAAGCLDPVVPPLFSLAHELEAARPRAVRRPGLAG